VSKWPSLLELLRGEPDPVGFNWSRLTITNSKGKGQILI